MQSASPPVAGTIRMVLIEDYKLVRIGLRSVLSEEPNLEVVAEAECGEEGIDLIKRHKPDVVLLDLGLPNMDGIDVARQVREFAPDIKVIILTSHEAEDEVLAALSAGAHAYCLKEITSSRLIEVVNAVHDGAAWLDPKIAGFAMEMFSRPSARKVIDTENQANLTDRELQVLALLVEGKSNQEIGADLCVSVHTAKAHVCSILQKLAVNDRVQAAVKAVKECLV